MLPSPTLKGKWLMQKKNKSDNLLVNHLSKNRKINMSEALIRKISLDIANNISKSVTVSKRLGRTS